jgi:hypothetical protein
MLKGLAQKHLDFSLSMPITIAIEPGYWRENYSCCKFFSADRSGSAARCAERLCLSGHGSLSLFRALPAAIRGGAPLRGKRRVPASRRLAAHQTAQPHRIIYRKKLFFQIAEIPLQSTIFVFAGNSWRFCDGRLSIAVAFLKYWSGFFIKPGFGRDMPQADPAIIGKRSAFRRQLSAKTKRFHLADR